MRRRLIAVVGCVACLAAGTGWTQCLESVASVTHDVTGQPPEMGSASAVAVSGNYAYYNVGPVLHVADVSVPSDPRVMGEVTLRGSIKAIAVSGSIAYAAMGHAGLSIVDISNPWAPEETSAVDTSSESLDVAVSGEYLYVADGYAGLGVFDLADPAQPAPVSRFTMSHSANAVSIGRSEVCSYAFVNEHVGFLVIDVTDPRRPIEVGHFADPTTADIALSGGYAFVSGRTRLRVIDVSDPPTPVEVGEVRYLTMYRFAAPSIAASPSHVYVGGFARIMAIDVNPPVAPEIECELLWDYPTGRIVWAGGYLYVPVVDVWAQRAGLKVFREGDADPADFGSIECIGPPLGYLSFAE